MDTHVWLRWIAPGAHPLPAAMIEALAEADFVHVSAISHWEVAYLEKRGRVTLPIPILEWLQEATDGSSILTLDLTAAIARRAALLPDLHRDPADRFIAATALTHNIHLATLDQQILAYPELCGLVV